MSQIIFDDASAAEILAAKIERHYRDGMKILFYGFGKIFFQLLAALKSKSSIDLSTMKVCDNKFTAQKKEWMAAEFLLAPTELVEREFDLVVICSLFHRDRMKNEFCSYCPRESNFIDLNEEELLSFIQARYIEEPRQGDFHFSPTLWKLMPPTEDAVYSAFLKDKKVIIVGPAPHLLGSSSSAFIDSHDVVIRVNRGFPVAESSHQDLGRRCDILYHCIQQSRKHGSLIDVEMLKNQGVQWLCPSTPRWVHPFVKDHQLLRAQFSGHDKPHLHFIDDEFHLLFQRLLGARPSTGLTAIVDLLRQPLKSLHVTGFTFFATGYPQGYNLQPPPVQSNHSSSHEKKCIQILLSEDPRLELDAEAMKQLKIQE